MCPVVNTEVPVAVGPVRSLAARAPQRYRLHARQSEEPIGDMINKGLLIHHAMIAVVTFRREPITQLTRK